MSVENKILELINEYQIERYPEVTDIFFRRPLLDRFYRYINFYETWEKLQAKDNKDFASSFYLETSLMEALKSVLHKYNPNVKPEQAREKEIEVNGVTKGGAKTGKRVVVKFGRWLGQAFPFLTDVQKEKLVDWYSNTYGPLEADFYRTTTGFESIVTKPIGRKSGFYITMWQKSLSDSCMRYDASDLGLSEHPYSAYESGDWELCYLLDKDKKLLGRCLVNLPTKTHSAIYGASLSAVRILDEEMDKLGYNQASDDAAEWSGSRLLYIEDTYGNEYDVIPVHLMPYVDIFEGYAYHDRKHIYLSVISGRPEGTYYVDPFEASGHNEL